jgi:hypothetical protein
MRIPLLAILAFAICVSTDAQIFSPDVISDAKWQWRITFTPDGATAYFAESDGFFPATRKATIYESHLRDGVWSEPAVAPFSGVYSDIDPFITPDGRRLYFSSIRPVDGAPKTDIDLWMVEKTAAGWGAPVRLGPEVNTPGDELYASASSDGTLYFASGPQAPGAGLHFDIYRARPGDGTAFAPREALGAGVNTQPSASDAGLQAAWEFNPEISTDGRTLLFASLRPGGAGLGDLYVSRFEDGAWTAAARLGPAVNTAADEYHPTLSRDGKTLYFVRRVSGHGDFYSIPLTETSDAAAGLVVRAAR